MKKALYILLFCTLMACGSNHQKQDTINTLGNFTEQTVEQQPTTVEGDCIMEDVLRLIPKDVLPENMRQLDLAAEILKKAEGGDDSYEVQCNYAYYDRTEGECDHSAIQLKSFTKADGSHLVLYAYSGGCDCNVMIDHKAYIYQEGQLSETSWPFPEPGFDEFYNALSFCGADKADIDFTKQDGMPYYMLSPDDNILCDWAACDYYDFLDYQHPSPIIGTVRVSTRTTANTASAAKATSADSNWAAQCPKPLTASASTRWSKTNTTAKRCSLTQRQARTLPRYSME